MSILLDQNTRVIVQGLGKQGAFHAGQCLEYGARIVGGVSPGKGGTSLAVGPHQLPVFDTVAQAARRLQPSASIVFVPPAGAADAGLALVVCITEGIPVADMVRAWRFLHNSQTRLIGPNCPGIISPGKAKLGIMPGYIHTPPDSRGGVGVVSRSGTLTYEAVGQLTALGIPQTTCLGIGGDPIIGANFVDVLRLFHEDPETRAIVMIGEIGGAAEEQAAAFIGEKVRKPVVGFIAGQTAPPGRRMGHAGAIISGGSGAAAEKIRAMQQAGIHVVPTPADIGDTMQKLWQSNAP